MVGREEIMISEDEAALYDRQIRLWGLEAQKRLRGAKVLLIGLGGLGAEVAKNLTLAGIKSLTLLEDRAVNGSSANFLVPPGSDGKNVAEASLDRLQRLNPMVTVVSDPSSVSSKSEEYFGNFDVVCATRIAPEESFRINDACRKHSVPFYVGDVFGLLGYFFVDLLDHEYAEEVTVPVGGKESGTQKVTKSEQTEIKTVKKTLSYVPYKAAWEADYSRLNRKSWKRIQSHVILTKSLLMFRSQMNRDAELATRQTDLDSLHGIKDHILHDLKLDPQSIDPSAFETTFGELSPAAAVLGGVLAQEIIKAVSHKDLPIHNYFFFNGATDRTGWVEAVGF